MELVNGEGLVVLKPVGRIDHTNAAVFQTELTPYIDSCLSGGARILLDFSGVEYISSVGLRVIMMAAKLLKPVSGGIFVAGLQPVVREIFKISRFDYVLPIYDDPETAKLQIASAANREAGQ